MIIIVVSSALAHKDFVSNTGLLERYISVIITVVVYSDLSIEQCSLD